MRTINVLFVCTGNTCRSVIAQGLLRKMWDQQLEKKSALAVESAGLYAFSGIPASENAIKVLSEYGVEMGEHRSRKVNLDMVRQADLIVVMTRQQREELVRLFPEAGEKVKLLREFDGSDEDVMDPFGGAEEDYRQVLEVIRGSLKSLISYLLEKY